MAKNHDDIHHNDEPTFNALQGADPTEGQPDPDLSAIRARVLAETSNSRTHHIGRVVLSAAACLVLVAGAGALGFAVGQSRTQTIEVTASSPMVLPSGEANPQMETSPMVGPQSADSKMATSSMIGFGHVVYESRWASQPTAPATSEVLAFDPLDEQAAKAALTSLATALNVSGEPRLDEYGSWSISDDQGMVVLTVGADGMSSFSYSDSSSPAVMPCSVEEPNTSAGSEPGCEMPQVTATRKGALQSAQAIVRANGGSPEDFTWDVQHWQDGPFQVTAMSKQLITDSATPWSFTFYSNDKPVFASGYLARTASLGEYPIINADEAVMRLNDPRFGPMFGGMMPMAKGGTAIDSPIAQGNLNTKPMTPTTPMPGESIAWPVQRVTLTNAKLQLAQYWQPNGAVLMVPAYLMTDQDGGQVTVLAVANGSLNFSQPTQ